MLWLKRRLRDDISYPRLNLTVGYSKGNKIIDVSMDIHGKSVWIWIWIWIWMANFISTATVAYLGFGKGGHGERAKREPITGV